MGLLKDTTVYLMGPVEFVDEDSSVRWRETVTEKLSDRGIITYDPLFKPDWLSDATRLNPASFANFLNDRLESGSMNKTWADSEQEQVEETYRALFEVRDYCLALTNAANFGIVNLPRKFTSGTFEEVKAMHARKAPVFFNCPDGVPGWIYSMFGNKDVYFSSMDAVVDRILEIDNGDFPLDPLEWIFLQQNNQR